jgi:NAD(P)-dependent dehydrogenase (short-subunit alcohol dehydrogenase family)
VTTPANAVFISGGGSGIGRYLARHYAGRGLPVAVFDLAIPESVRDELARLPGSPALSFHEVDVCDAAGLEAAARAAVGVAGAPGLAINCAGIQIAGRFADLSEAQFSRVIDINLKGSRNFAAAVLPHMERGSKLALVASLAGLVSNYAYSAYNASKFGVVGLAGALRLECLPRGIDVAAICPPEVDTPMVEEELKSMDPITRELKQVAGTLDLESAGKEIIAGLAGSDFLVIPGTRARWVARLSRWFPGLLRRKTDAVITRMTAGGSN